MTRPAVPATRAETDVVVRKWRDGVAWDAFVHGAEDSTVAHRWAWLDVVARAYGHPVLPFAATRGGELVGVLPLVLVRNRLLGRHLVSMPYLDSGGVCVRGDGAAADALVSVARDAAREHRAELELRQYALRPFDLVPSTHKVTMTLDISDGEAAVWSRIKSNRRGQVRKAERHGLAAALAGAEGVPAFCRVLATNMRDLGSPMHRTAFFAEAVRAFGDDARLVLVRDGGSVVGAGLVFVHNDVATLPYSSSLRSSFSRGSNQLLYWAAIRYAVSRGCRVFDFGRSTPGSGTYEAKREWGASSRQLYWYHERPVRQESFERRQQLVASVWRRLPLPVATACGHLIRGSLPQ